jgi:hypothetical protein
MTEKEDDENGEARRQFLQKAGKFAAVTPVVITGLLSVSKGNYAMAISGSGSSRHANNGFGNGAGDGIPGKSGGKGANGKNGPIDDSNR